MHRMCTHPLDVATVLAARTPGLRPVVVKPRLALPASYIAALAARPVRDDSSLNGLVFDAAEAAGFLSDRTRWMQEQVLGNVAVCWLAVCDALADIDREQQATPKPWFGRRAWEHRFNTARDEVWFAGAVVEAAHFAGLVRAG